jgi:hypothetical protein
MLSTLCTNTRGLEYLGGGLAIFFPFSSTRYYGDVRAVKLNPLLLDKE